MGYYWPPARRPRSVKRSIWNHAAKSAAAIWQLIARLIGKPIEIETEAA